MAIRTECDEGVQRVVPGICLTEIITMVDMQRCLRVATLPTCPIVALQNLQATALPPRVQEFLLIGRWCVADMGFFCHTYRSPMECCYAPQVLARTSQDVTAPGVHSPRADEPGVSVSTVDLRASSLPAYPG